MSGKTRIMGIGKARGEVVAEASEAAVTPAEAPAARIVEQRQPVDHLQEARDLEDAAMAYSEVVRALGVITKTTQAGESTYAGLTLPEMAANLESAWARWDTAQRRLIGPQRTG
jgi:hypothetical protein